MSGCFGGMAVWCEEGTEILLWSFVCECGFCEKCGDGLGGDGLVTKLCGRSVVR